MKSCTIRALLTLLLICLVAAGCTPAAQEQSAARAVRFDAGLAQKVTDAAARVPGVQDAAAVVMDRDILAGVKVTGFDRLRLKAIRTGVGDQLKAGNPGYGVQVTADKKLFAELRALAGQIRAGGFAPAQVQQKVGKIKKEMNG